MTPVVFSELGRQLISDDNWYVTNDWYEINPPLCLQKCWTGAGLTDVWPRWEQFPYQLFTGSVILLVKDGLHLHPPPRPPPHLPPPPTCRECHQAGVRPADQLQSGLPLCAAHRVRGRGRWSPQCRRGERERETSSRLSHPVHRVNLLQQARSWGELTRAILATGLWGQGNYQRGPTSRPGENQSGEPSFFY